MLKVLLAGARGRMGREIISRSRLCEDLCICAGVDACAADRDDAEFPVYEKLSEVKEDWDVLIDFTSPAFYDELLPYLAEKKKAAVLCTTGLSAAQEEQIRALSRSCPVFRSENMSVGIYVLSVLAAEANRLLGKDFDCEILEAHHRGKKDAPSGTAYLLARAVQASDPGERPLCTDRSARHEARRKGEIGMQALRMGAVAGEHKVYFASESEIISLSHQAENRGVFADGALKAARFTAGQAEGFYTMKEMLDA